MSPYKGFTEAQARAHKKYMKDVATIQIRTTIERRDKIKVHAETKGESVNAFINRAIDEAMKREGTRVAHDDLPAGGACTEGIQRGGGGDDGAGVISIISDGEAAPRRLVDVSPTPDEESSPADEDLPS